MNTLNGVIRFTVVGAALTALQRKGDALAELIRRWLTRRGHIRELEDLLAGDERVLRDIGIERGEIIGAIHRLRSAPLRDAGATFGLRN